MVCSLENLLKTSREFFKPIEYVTPDGKNLFPSYKWVADALKEFGNFKCEIGLNESLHKWMGESIISCDFFRELSAPIHAMYVENGLVWDGHHGDFLHEDFGRIRLRITRNVVCNLDILYQAHECGIEAGIYKSCK